MKKTITALIMLAILQPVFAQSGAVLINLNDYEVETEGLTFPLEGTWFVSNVHKDGSSYTGYLIINEIHEDGLRLYGYFVWYETDGSFLLCQDFTGIYSSTISQVVLTTSYSLFAVIDGVNFINGTEYNRQGIFGTWEARFISKEKARRPR